MPEPSPVLTPSTDPPLLRRLSSSSVFSLAEPGTLTPKSSTSIQFAEGDVQVVTEEGLPHATIKLHARHYKSSAFASQLLELCKTLHISSWSIPDIKPGDIKVFKVAGSMTNAVFFISSPSIPGVRTVLLRIYGPSSGALISRPRELHTLHVLSSQYHIGPRIYGTFENGRLEEYFESTTLTAADLRDPTISRWIGARMAELHSVDIEAVEDTSPETRGEGKGWEIGATKNVRTWLDIAVEVLQLPNVPSSVKEELNIDAFREEWNAYIVWLKEKDDRNAGSRRVFAHNDAQYGNLLRVKNLKEGLPDHRQIIVVDFEYASPNPASCDIANHFHEWTADYHGSAPHKLDPSRYPTQQERFNFYRAYLDNVPEIPRVSLSQEQLDAQTLLMDEQVRYWSPASHALWAVWGIVQAREDVETANAEPEFDYLGYSLSRMEGFRRELKALRVV